MIPAHASEATTVADELDTDPTSGLSQTEAARRLAEHGPNTLTERTRPSRFRVLVRQFEDAIVWLLVVAAAISGLLLDEWLDAAVIGAIVVVNAVIGFVQENRAEQALASLRTLAAPRARVVRDGQRTDLDAADVVPGDVLLLEAGDRVPADARLTEAVDLMVSEAPLTGESYPVTKQCDPVEADTSLADRSSMVFMGTAVQKGRGRALVTATGPRTSMGDIAELLATEEEQQTPLQADIQRLGRQLAVIALGVAALILALGLLRGYEPASIFLTAVALAVAAIPEGLPAVVTITLANGVQAMARQAAIVRRLPAVEALGSANVVCTDKTGTVTMNEIRVQELGLDEGLVALADLDADDPVGDRYALVAALCNDASTNEQGGTGDPTEVALLTSLPVLGADPAELRGRFDRVDEAGFDSERMRMSTLHARPGGGWLLAVKGAPERVVERAAWLEGPEGLEHLDEVQRQRLGQYEFELAARGLRTLALAYRELDGDEHETPTDVADLERDLVLIGIAGMSDEVRPEVPDAVAEAQQAGIRVVLITGDHRDTAEAVGRDIGVMTDELGSMTGRELQQLPEAQLGDAVPDVAVFARVEPRDKASILRGWKQRGGIVAMTGDGVNDAPALQSADIGVAMGSGTDVAKDAADMVLTDDNFATIVRAVREGRRIFTNLKKVVYFLLSANVSEVLVIALGILAFGHLGEPLLPTQILWMNLVTDGLPVLALGVAAADRDVMARPPLRTREILGRRQEGMLLLYGALLSLASIGVLVYGNYVLDAEFDRVRTLVFSTLVIAQLLHALNINAARSSVWRVGIRGNRLLVGALVVSALLQVLVVQSPPGQTLFDTVPLGADEWLAVLVASLAVTVAIDLSKRVLGPIDRNDGTDRGDGPQSPAPMSTS